MWHTDKLQCQDGHSETVPPSENLAMDGKTSEVGTYVVSKCRIEFAYVNALPQAGKFHLHNHGMQYC